MGNKSTGRGRSSREGANLSIRRAEVFRRWTAGESLRSIARSLKIGKTTVAGDCLLALQESRDASRASVSDAVQRELHLLDKWEIRLEQTYDETGDWKIFSEGIARCSAARRKLLGLDKPVRIEAQATTEVSLTKRPSIDELRDKILRNQEIYRQRKSDHEKQNESGGNNE